MKVWLFLVLSVIWVIGWGVYYVVSTGSNALDVFAGGALGFVLGALFGWVMTELEREKEKGRTHET